MRQEGREGGDRYGMGWCCSFRSQAEVKAKVCDLVSLNPLTPLTLPCHAAPSPPEPWGCRPGAPCPSRFLSLLTDQTTVHGISESREDGHGAATPTHCPHASPYPWVQVMATKGLDMVRLNPLTSPTPLVRMVEATGLDMERLNPLTPLTFPLNPFVQVVEAKGLDMVRRDWCGLSKDAGNYALGQILSGQPKEEVVAAVHERLRQLKEEVRQWGACLLYTSPSPRDGLLSRMPSSA